MIETYEYNLTDQENDSFFLKCKVEYDTNNDYNTNYYFFDGDKWLKDFIDLNKLSPNDKASRDEFEDFVTRVHDYMVHGNIWKDLKAMNDKQTTDKEQYKLHIIANKL